MLVAGMWKVRNLRENLWNWKTLRPTALFFFKMKLFETSNILHMNWFSHISSINGSELKPKIYKFAHTHMLESNIWNFFIGFSGCDTVDGQNPAPPVM